MTLDTRSIAKKHSKILKADNNRCNGSFEKTIVDEHGSQITVDVPRDRE